MTSFNNVDLGTVMSLALAKCNLKLLIIDRNIRIEEQYEFDANRRLCYQSIGYNYVEAFYRRWVDAENRILHSRGLQTMYRVPAPNPNVGITCVVPKEYVDTHSVGETDLTEDLDDDELYTLEDVIRNCDSVLNVCFCVIFFNFSIIIAISIFLIIQSRSTSTSQSQTTSINATATAFTDEGRSRTLLRATEESPSLHAISQLDIPSQPIATTQSVSTPSRSLPSSLPESMTFPLVPFPPMPSLWQPQSSYGTISWPTSSNPQTTTHNTISTTGNKRKRNQICKRCSLPIRGLHNGTGKDRKCVDQRHSNTEQQFPFDNMEVLIRQRRAKNDWVSQRSIRDLLDDYVGSFDDYVVEAISAAKRRRV